ncbi:DUF2304 domain-containing protein [Candidatus Woesearchaeota archaeon]|nr:DUF2304 domain-containing protein [Candidatus Woesearchaeota archaeon]
MAIGLQLFGVIFALIMVFFTYSSYKRKDLKAKDFALWSFVWLLFIIAVVFPNSLNIVFETFGIRGALWFITIASIIFLTCLTFALHKSVRKTQRKMEKITQEIALRGEK